MQQQIDVGRRGVRNGYFGNPFVVSKNQSRVAAVARFAVYATTKFSDEDLAELRDKDLYCPGCRGTGPCHAQVLAWLAVHPRAEWQRLIQRSNEVLG